MTKATQQKFYQLLGENIRHARKTVNLKQDALASYLGLSRASVINIEKGRQHPPLHQLNDIARILKVDISSLIPKISDPDLTSKVNWEKIIIKSVKGNEQAGDKLRGFLNELNSIK